MELLVKNLQGEEVSKLEVSNFVFDSVINEDVVSRVVQWQRSKCRNQVKTLKNRSEINMTGKKAYRQKGTGNARRGPKSTNIMRGGGVAHGIRYISHEYTLPKKVRRLGLRSTLSFMAKQGRLLVLDSMEFQSNKTKDFQSTMNNLNVNSALIVSAGELNNNLALSSRNLHKFDIMQDIGINVLDILSKDILIMNVDAVKNVETRLLQDAKDKA